MPGTRVAAGVLAAERVPAGHKVAVRPLAVGEPILRYGQIIGFATAADCRGPARARAQLRHGRFRQGLRLWRRRGADRLCRPSRDLPGHPPPGRPGRHAQLHRHPHQRELQRARGQAWWPTRSAATRSPATTRWRDYPNVDGVVALTHKTGCGMTQSWSRWRVLRRTLGRLRAACELRLRHRARPRLRGEPDRRADAGADVSPGGCARWTSRRWAARARRWRPGSTFVREALAEANNVRSRAGARQRIDGGVAMRRLRRLLRRVRQPGAGRRERSAGAPRRHRHPVRNA